MYGQGGVAYVYFVYGMYYQFNVVSNVSDIPHAILVRALEPVTGAEDRLVKLLQEANVPVLGCVLSDVPMSVVEGYHNYQHYYSPAANSSVWVRTSTLACSSRES